MKKIEIRSKREMSIYDKGFHEGVSWSNNNLSKSGVYVEFDNLTIDEKLLLLSDLYKFAKYKLPRTKNLVIRIKKEML